MSSRDEWPLSSGDQAAVLDYWLEKIVEALDGIYEELKAANERERGTK